MREIKNIRTPKGKLITANQYLAMVNRLMEPHPCEHEHLECAAWNHGPCMDELLSQQEAENVTSHREADEFGCKGF